jgi:hypothetical protein
LGTKTTFPFLTIPSGTPILPYRIDTCVGEERLLPFLDRAEGGFLLQDRHTADEPETSPFLFHRGSTHPVFLITLDTRSESIHVRTFAETTLQPLKPEHHFSDESHKT